MNTDLTNLKMTPKAMLSELVLLKRVIAEAKSFQPPENKHANNNRS